MLKLLKLNSMEGVTKLNISTNCALVKNGTGCSLDNRTFAQILIVPWRRTFVKSLDMSKEPRKHVTGSISVKLLIRLANKN